MGKEKIIIGSSSGATYTIEKEIGRGGQGRVYSIVGGKYAFKLIGKKTSSKAQLLKRKISYIKTRPIEDLPISKPLEIAEGNWLNKDSELKKVFGYNMEMATDMMPIENLIKPDTNKDFKTWWLETGGLKKRILILKKIAETLAKLHSRGLVYGDFSLSNIFVSNDKKYSEIFFIDADNITHESKVGTAVYTPGYAAPEIIQTVDHKASSGYDTFTDDYAFAVIAYQLLTLNHPFIGDYVNDGEPELEEKAYLGLIPWVNHSTDNINNAITGISPSLTISKKMMDAFRQTFEIGIMERTKRTSSSKWVEILTGSLDAIIECQNKSCAQNFFFSKDLKCPFCETKMDFVGMARIHPLIKKIKEEAEYNYSVALSNVQNVGKALRTKLLTPNKYIILTENDFLLNNSNRQLFKIKLSDDSLYVKGLALNSISIISNKKYKKKVPISNEIKVDIKGDTILFFNDLNKYQRILIIKKYSS